MAQISMAWSGPLPHSSEFAAYERTLPGAADRILAMTEKQGDHRRALESMALKSEVDRGKWGQIFAFVLALLVVGGSILAIETGHPLAGFGGILVGLGSLVGVFVYGTYLRRPRAAPTQNGGNRREANGGVASP
jgi:uncharacterized membrane protein